MPVMVTSAGRRVELVRLFQDAIRGVDIDGGVLAVDRSTRSPALYVADASATVPSSNDPSFIDSLLGICEANEVRLLVPTIDTELFVLAKSAHRFESIGTRVLVGDPAAVEIALDKRLTHSYLQEKEYPTVRQVDKITAESVESLGLPFLIKPTQGSASIGVRIIQSIADLGDGSGLVGFIAQEIAQGFEVTVDVLASKSGDIVSAVPRQRLEVRSGEVSKAITIDDPLVTSIARGVVASLPRPAGPYCVQIFHDLAQEQARVIEINARFGGGYPLTARAGSNYPLWVLAETIGLPWRPELTCVVGRMMLRYDEAVYVDE